MTWGSWAVQTDCAECGKDTYLMGGLCRICSESMGYTTPEEDTE